MSRYMLIIKVKTSKNVQKMNSHARKNKTAQQPHTHSRVTQGRTAVRPTTDRGGHHGQPVVATCPPDPFGFSNDALCACFGASFWAAVLPMLGHFGPHLLSSLIHMTLNFILSPITWLISHESAIKTRRKPKQA